MVETDVVARKDSLRAEFRALRRELPERAARSERIWARVRALPEVVEARTVMVFDSVPGEPETARFLEWCRGQGKHVVLPGDDPASDPPTVDVVVVPGVAFTWDGHRLGQGGGWYDRFLARLPEGTPTIGVCFAEQMVVDLPVEPHDVVLGRVVTDLAASRRRGQSEPS